jgi:hypothetical protein
MNHPAYGENDLFCIFTTFVSCHNTPRCWTGELLYLVLVPKKRFGLCDVLSICLLSVRRCTLTEATRDNLICSSSYPYPDSMDICSISFPVYHQPLSVSLCCQTYALAQYCINFPSSSRYWVRVWSTSKICLGRR